MINETLRSSPALSMIAGLILGAALVEGAAKLRIISSETATGIKLLVVGKEVVGAIGMSGIQAGVSAASQVIPPALGGLGALGAAAAPAAPFALPIVGSLALSELTRPQREKIEAIAREKGLTLPAGTEVFFSQP